MTWLQLYEQIRSMSAEEKLRTVKFYESYDEDPAILEAHLHRASEPLTSTAGTRIEKGEAYLA